MENNSEIVIYQNHEGDIRIDVHLIDDTVWLSQAGMATLFQTSVPNISMHIRNIYEEGELEQVSTVKKFLIVRNEGDRSVKREIEHYNLDVIISVGYRIKSKIATQFRIWATQTLKEYIVKGFVLNDDRFKSGNSMNYFNELQERIREIRLSERFFYQKIKDIYTTSIDYDPNDEKTILMKMKLSCLGCLLNNIWPLLKQWHSSIPQCIWMIGLNAWILLFSLMAKNCFIMLERFPIKWH